MFIRSSDPFRDFDRLTAQLLGTTNRPAVMPMDAWREGDRFVIELDLPGVSRDSIDLDVERNVLTIRAERVARNGDWEALASERPRGAFSRQLVLGDNLDLDQIEAAYDDGVLRLIVPVAEKAKPRKIEIGSTEPSGDRADRGLGTGPDPAGAHAAPGRVFCAASALDAHHLAGRRRALTGQGVDRGEHPVAGQLDVGRQRDAEEGVRLRLARLGPADPAAEELGDEDVAVAGDRESGGAEQPADDLGDLAGARVDAIDRPLRPGWRPRDRPEARSRRASRRGPARRRSARPRSSTSCPRRTPGTRTARPPQR